MSYRLKAGRATLRTVVFALVLLAATLPLRAGVSAITFASDEPFPAAGAFITPNRTVRLATTVYGADPRSPSTLPPEVGISALTLLADGTYLFSADTPFTVAGATYRAGDVVRYAAGAYSLYLGAATLGLPPQAIVDALAFDAQGRLVLSFEEPTVVGATAFAPADLALWNGTALSVYWSGAAHALAPGTNVCGAEVTSTSHVFVAFDEPSQVAGAWYLPGDIVEFNGSRASLWLRPPSFPAGNAMRDFAFEPGAAGRVPDGLNGKPLLLRRSGRLGQDLAFAWDPACGALATDYALYQGTIGNWDAYGPQECSMGDVREYLLAMPAGNRFFLVVPHNGFYEGSHGRNSRGHERKPPAKSCLPQGSTACP